MGVTHVGLANYDKAWGHEAELAVTTTPVVILPSAAIGMTKAVIQVLDNDIVYRDDGGTPTATHGLIITAGDILVYEGSVTAMQALVARTITGTARLRVAYYGW